MCHLHLLLVQSCKFWSKNLFTQSVCLKPSKIIVSNRGRAFFLWLGLGYFRLYNSFGDMYGGQVIGVKSWWISGKSGKKHWGSATQQVNFCLRLLVQPHRLEICKYNIVLCLRIYEVHLTNYNVKELQYFDEMAVG